ncbi:MAG: FAD-dependent oxidoreductase [Spirochaetes bacterium]|nr:FAD-dependent oxidoreductase [Spirochaetota bacterium]
MPKFELKLIKKEEVAKNTMAFLFEKPAEFDFRAGQFGDFTLIAPPETDAKGNTRAFSIATGPFAHQVAIATRMRDSAFKRVLKNLPIGASVEFDGPFGDFKLHKTETTPAVFLIGGIGITPVRSIIAQATHDKLAHSLTLFYANNTPAEAAFLPDFKRFAEENEHFNFVPVMSADNTFNGEKGFIDKAMIARYASDLTKPIFYIAGPAGMVAAMRKILLDAKANEDNIRTEEFSGY